MIIHRLMKYFKLNLRHTLLVCSMLMILLSILFYSISNFLISQLLFLIPLSLVLASELYVEILESMYNRIKISRIVPNYVVESNNLEVKLYVNNNSRILLSNLELCDEYIGQGSINRKCIRLSIPPRSKVKATYNIKGVIGKYLFKNIRIVFNDLWGISRREKVIEYPSTSRIIPKVISYYRSSEGIKSLMALTTTRGIRLGLKSLTMDFIGHREYVLGDPAKIIDWKASARRAKLMVKEYNVGGVSRLAIMLIVSSKVFEKGIYPYIARELASIAYSSSILGIETSLTILTPCSKIYLSYGKGKEHALKILESFGDVLWPIKDLEDCNEDYNNYVKEYTKMLTSIGCCKLLVYVDDTCAQKYLPIIRDIALKVKGNELVVKVIEV